MGNGAAKFWGLNMEDDKKVEISGKTRRAFVKTAAQVAVTAPAVGLLLSASTKPAAAAVSLSSAVTHHILDDFTFGNNKEDIDAIGCQSNVNCLTGAPEQDDVWIPPPG